MNRKNLPIIIVVICSIVFVNFAVCYGILLSDALSKKTYSDDLVLFDYEISSDKNTKRIIGSPSPINNEEYDYQTISSIAMNGYVFPPSITSSFSNYFFFFSEKHDCSRGTVFRSEIFLASTYDNETFEFEKKRIESLECYRKKPVYIEDLFPLPAFVASYNMNSCFEYALLDCDNSKIYYIYLYSVNSYSQIVFDSNYAPTKKLSESNFPQGLVTSYGAYSMYWTY